MTWQVISKVRPLPMDPLGRARALIPPRAAPLTLRGGCPDALPFSIFRSIFHNPRLYLSLTYILNGTNRGFWPAFLSQIHVQGFLAISMISAV